MAASAARSEVNGRRKERTGAVRGSCPRLGASLWDGVEMMP